MFERFLTYRQIDDLEKAQRTNAATKSDLERRALMPIAVIDDEPFTLQNTLKNNGYDIHVLGDIKTLNEVENYNIILCDLQGVGRHLNEKNQGAYLIDEIKRNHPEKFVIAYTGGAVDDAVTIRANESADYFLRKDADVEEWRDKLDRIIEFLSNPVLVWRRQRFALIDSDVSTMDILKLEDAFVRSIDMRNQNHFLQLSEKSTVGADARAIAQSLIASGIFKLLVG
jgi:hypothetical protein